MFESVHIGAPPPRCCIFLSSSRTLWLTTGPHCCPAPPVSRVVPRPAALPSLLACLRHERALPHPTAPPRAIPAPRSGCRPHTPLFLSFFLCSVACPSRSPPPHFPLLFSLVRPLIWGSRWILTLFCSMSTPELELPSFSTAYVPASPAPATGEPSSSLVPA
jgi:hypothetical protein